MMREEADELAKRITSTLRGGPPRNEWANYLAGLDDHERATRVFNQMRTSLEFGPSFKQFGEMYRALAWHAPPAPVVVETGPRLTRAERIAILEANGAPARFIHGKAEV